jgi:peptidoglycan/LPS O-acetylase OafA/YrhL
MKIDTNGIAVHSGPQSPSGHFTLLDGLRSVAALAVVAYHFGDRAALPALFPRGYLAVDFFFVLSGFVLAYAYGDRLRTSLAARTYIVHRLIRLLPILVPGAAFGAGIEIWRPGTDLSFGHLLAVAGATILSCLAMPLPIATSMEQAIFPINGPVWSLFFELLASIVFIFVAKSAMPRAAAAILMLVGAAGLAAFAFPSGVSRLGALVINWPGGLPRVLFSFFAGVVVFANRHRIPALRAAIFPCVLVALFMVPTQSNSLDIVIDLLAIIVVFPLLVGSASNSEPAASCVAACALGGDLSYPLYAIHYPIVRAICFVLNKHAVGVPTRLAAIAGGMVTVAAIGWAVFHFYDRPVRRYLTQRLLGKRTRDDRTAPGFVTASVVAPAAPTPSLWWNRHAMTSLPRNARDSGQ